MIESCFWFKRKTSIGSSLMIHIMMDFNERQIKHLRQDQINMFVTIMDATHIY